MNLRKLEKKFHTKHLSPSTVIISFAICIALLLTVIIAFNGTYNTFERSLAYIGQFCNPSKPCPAGEYCSSSTANGTCVPYLCEPYKCPNGCVSPATKQNDCLPWCNNDICGAYGCNPPNPYGGLCATSGKKCTETCKAGWHCEIHDRNSGNSLCVPDTYGSFQINCVSTAEPGHAGWFCAKGSSCPQPGFNQVNLNTQGYGCIGNQAPQYGPWVCCQRSQ